MPLIGRGREEARMGYMKLVIILKGLVFIRTYDKLGVSRRHI